MIELGLNDIDIWTLDLAVDDDRLQALERTLSSFERMRANRLRFETDRRRRIAARGLLREVLARYLDAQPREVAYDFGPHGKPYPAAGHGSDIQFNMTDSGDLALLAVSRGRELGIDIEYHKPGRDGVAIARRRFHPSEADQLDSLPEAEAQAVFVSAWTRKEAFLKAIGTGMHRPLSSFRVSILPADPPAIVECEEPGRWTTYAIEVPPGFAASLVAENAAECRLRLQPGRVALGGKPE